MGRASMGPSGSGIFGCISPRTATLAIAILGIIIHLNTFSWLGALSSTLPDVPERGAAPPASAAFIPSADRFAHSAAKADQLINLDIYAHPPSAAANDDASGNKNVYLPEWVAEAKAYLKAQGLTLVPTQGNSAEASSNKISTNNKASEATIPGRFTDAASDASPISYQVLEDGAEQVERMQWDALRVVISTLRWYILFSVLCCCAGVIGVLRSQLLLSRLFVIHSFLDFLLSTLSLFALAIVCTYPSVRAHLCDEFGSGELQAWFSPSKPSALPPKVAQAMSDSATRNARTVAPGSLGDVTVVASGWETLLDGVFASENCEESFRTTLVPLLMVFGLFFTAVRLQCFFMVQRFYAGLLRSKVYQYGYGGASTGHVESGNSTPMSQIAGDGGRGRWKESKLLD
ncbi:uncharacterized protein UTRI_00696 [Ustilago trichophora]|uniref:Uncharacterized protein n=1 Tax=Ustilago trichophora TaxID=86804 RepID=A0A5C3DW03_9BASI|nr:uncharacterized protein UTRI_00696 [Ustilago trichophora]